MKAPPTATRVGPTRSKPNCSYSVGRLLRCRRPQRDVIEVVVHVGLALHERQHQAAAGVEHLRRPCGELRPGGREIRDPQPDVAQRGRAGRGVLPRVEQSQLPAAGVAADQREGVLLVDDVHADVLLEERGDRGAAVDPVRDMVESLRAPSREGNGGGAESVPHLRRRQCYPLRRDAVRVRVPLLRAVVFLFAVERLAVERLAVDFRFAVDFLAVERLAVERFAVLLRLAVLLRFAVDFFAVERFAVLRLAVLRLAVLRFAVLLRLAVLFRFVVLFRFAVDFFLAVERLAVLRFAVDFLAVERLAVDFFFAVERLAVDFFAVDFFFAVDRFAVDFFAEDFLAVDFFFAPDELRDDRDEERVRAETVRDVCSSSVCPNPSGPPVDHSVLGESVTDVSV